jgi:predicted acyl esterase
MYAVKVLKSAGYFDTIVKRLKTAYSKFFGEHMPDHVIVELWKHKGNDERYALTIYCKDERLPQLATSVMGSYGLETTKDIDQWVEKERGPIRREVLGQVRLNV